MTSREEKSSLESAGGLPHTAPVAGRLGWLEFTTHVVRDRAHTAWAWLQEEELVAAVHERGGIAAYLPGEKVGTRDQIVLRLAVDPDGHVAVAEPGHPPSAGPLLEDFVLEVLDELRVLAIIDAETSVGPPGLPADQLRQDAERPDADTRQVYAWHGEDAAIGRLLAATLEQEVDLHRQGEWVIGAPRHGSSLALVEPPGRGRAAIAPFVIVSRQGDQRAFTYVEGDRPTDLRVQVQCGAALIAAPPPGAHPDTQALAQWLARPEESRENGTPSPTRVASPSPDQVAVIESVLSDPGADEALAQLCRAFRVPELVATLAEVRHREPDPVEPWMTVSPQSRRSMVASVITDAGVAEPTGSLPWQVLNRAIYHRPWLGLVLGFVEMVIAGGLVAMTVNGVLSPWWWIAVAAVVLLAMDHTSTAVIRRQALARARAQRTPD